MKIRVLIAAAVVCMAFAVGASAASAASYKTSSASGTSYATGSSSSGQAWKLSIGTFTCTNASWKTSFTGTSTAELVASEIAYSGCTVAGQALTFNMNGCTYRFGEPTGTASPFTVKTVKIECPSGKEIVITANTSGCTIKIPAQTLTSSSTIGNNGGPPKSASLSLSWSNITNVGSGGFCGGTSMGVYSGVFLIKGFSDSAHTKQVDFFVE